MITREDAGTALEDVKQTMDRSARAMGYKAASPHLLLWGIVWILGYGAMAAGLFPQARHWLVLIVLAMIASMVIGLRESRRATGRSDWRPPATIGAVTLFMVAQFTVLPPQTGQQIGTIIPLLVALAYGIIAVWTGGVRIGVTGLVVGLASLYAYHLQPEYFELLMAIFGGGGLMLGGLWLRRL